MTDLEEEVLRLLDTRRPGATTCPSEVARAADPENWRDLMEPVRAAARRLHAEGRVEWLQKGELIDPATAKGPVRIRRAT